MKQVYGLMITRQYIKKIANLALQDPKLIQNAHLLTVNLALVYKPCEQF